MNGLLNDLLDAGRIDAGTLSLQPRAAEVAVLVDRARRILVPDDDPRTQRRVRDALMAAGYAPLVTADPGDLPRLLRAAKPRLVRLDLMLPGVDGIELLEREPGLADLPVIFISGYGRDETTGVHTMRVRWSRGPHPRRPSSASGTSRRGASTTVSARSPRRGGPRATAPRLAASAAESMHAACRRVGVVAATLFAGLPDGVQSDEFESGSTGDRARVARSRTRSVQGRRNLVSQDGPVLLYARCPPEVRGVGARLGVSSARQPMVIPEASMAVQRIP